MIAQKGMNSFGFMQAITIGKRFVEVFRHHQQQKDSLRFVQRNYLKIIAPGFDPRQERNYRRSFELSEIFPCIRLISGCSINEFWLHMRKFRDMLARDDHEAMQWRCPIVEESKEMEFQRRLEFTTMDGDAMVPFAESNIVGQPQEEDDFINQKDDALRNWNSEDANEAKLKKHKPQQIVADENHLGPEQMEEDVDPEEEGDDNYDDEEEEEEEEEDGSDVDVMNY